MEKIFKSAGIDYYLDNGVWYAGERKKSTSFIGSVKADEETIGHVLSDLIFGRSAKTFTPRLVVGYYAVAIGNTEIIRREEGVLELKITEESNVSVTSPIECVYRRIEL